jgi:hypothetical protein
LSDDGGLDVQQPGRGIAMASAVRYFAARHYPLRSHREYWFLAARSGSLQAILGLAEGQFLTLLFDPTGKLLRAIGEPLDPADRPDPGPRHFDRMQVLFDRLADERLARFGLAEGTIRVRRFGLPEFGAGISGFTDELQDFMDSADGFSEAEAENYRDVLAEWVDESRYEFRWGSGFVVDREGDVVGS